MCGADDKKCIRPLSACQSTSCHTILEEQFTIVQHHILLSFEDATKLVSEHVTDIIIPNNKVKTAVVIAMWGCRPHQSNFTINELTYSHLSYVGSHLIYSCGKLSRKGHSVSVEHSSLPEAWQILMQFSFHHILPHVYPLLLPFRFSKR